MSLNYEVFGLGANDISPDDQRDSWEMHVQDNHGRLAFEFGHAETPTTTKIWTGATEVQRCGDLQCIRFRSDGITYRRSARHARQDDGRRTGKLLIPLRGEAVLDQDDHTNLLKPGEVCLFTFSRPFNFMQDHYLDALILDVPDEAMPPRHRSIKESTADNPVIAGVVAMATEMVRHRSTMSLSQFVSVNTAIFDLMATAIDGRDERRPVLYAIADAAVTYVLTHCQDPALTPESIAAHLGCSRRELENATRVKGTTPARLLRTARAAAARRQLRTGRPIAEIAYTSGFSSYTAFHRAFRAMYGCGPAEMREAMMSRSASDHSARAVGE